MTITIKKDIANDLIETKLKSLDDEIEKILQRWNITNIDDFLEAARTGRLEESEDDAISIQNLRDKRNKVAKLLNQ